MQVSTMTEVEYCRHNLSEPKISKVLRLTYFFTQAYIDHQVAQKGRKNMYLIYASVSTE